MADDAYLGYREGDADTPFGKFFQPQMAPLPRHVVEALEHGPQAGPALLAFEDAVTLDQEGYQQTENGYAVVDDGSVRVAVLPTCPVSARQCGSGGSAGTAVTRADTSCGTRARMCRRSGRTGTTTAATAQRVMSGARR